jgi:hypothetical protein
MKKITIFALLLIVVGIAWYLIAPAFNTIEIMEASPIKDNLETMNKETMEKFVEETKQMENVIVEMIDPMPAASIIATGEFHPRAHDVMGKALFIKEGDKNILRFEDFDTINGPNLHIYLSSSLGDDDIIDLGKIKATKGNVNYDVGNIDITKYNKVLVWCVPFKVLFSYAELG